MVVHGGDRGEINFGSFAKDTEVSEETKFIFEHTLAENIKYEKSFTLPTLREVLTHTNKNVFIYVEMKVPYCPDLKTRYRWREAAKETFKLLMEFEMKEHCFVQSFDHSILEEFEKICASELYKIRTMYLHNFHDYISLPPLSVILRQGDGLSVSSNHVTEELVQTCRQHGKILNVWIDCDVTVEDEYLHSRFLDLGVHCLITDFPLIATRVRHEYFTERQKPKPLDVMSAGLTQSTGQSTGMSGSETMKSDSFIDLKSEKVSD